MEGESGSCPPETRGAPNSLKIGKQPQTALADSCSVNFNGYLLH